MTKLTLRETAELMEQTAITETLPAAVEAKVREEAASLVDRCIGGFHFQDAEAVERELARFLLLRSIAAQNFRAQRHNLVAELTSKLGQAPIAVVPARQWREVTKRHGLITMSPTMDGRVAINRETSHAIGSRAAARLDDALNLIAPLIFVMMAVTFFGFFFTTHARSFTGFAAECLSSPLFLSVLAFSIIAPSTLFLVRRRVVDRALRSWIASHSRAELLSAVLKEGYSTSQASLRLPDPPAEVVTLLKKLAETSTDFNVTAEAEAISLEPSAASLFMTGYEEQEEINWMARDPIITIQHGNMIAIMAQFGDFEWEKAAVQEVIWDRRAYA